LPAGRRARVADLRPSIVAAPASCIHVLGGVSTDSCQSSTSAGVAELDETSRARRRTDRAVPDERRDRYVTHVEPRTCNDRRVG